jgi:hypothetical protein
MKNTLTILLVLLIVVTNIGCRKKCMGENPVARLLNNSSEAVDVSYRKPDGTYEKIQKLESGESTDYISFLSGNVTLLFHLNKKNYVKNVAMSQCFEYEVKFNENKIITATSIDRNK